MRPITIDPTTVIEPLCTLARSAGAAILSVYNSTDATNVHADPDIPFTTKSDNSPLTLADLAAHKIIHEGLQELTPDVLVVSEEGANAKESRVGITAFWLVDPLDGTKEFLARSNEYTVNIALVIDGVAVVGVVHAPSLGLTYWGGPGRGAWLETNKSVSSIAVAPRPANGGTWRAVASKSHLNSETEAVLARFSVVELVQAGSSLKFCRVAEGAADVYPRLGPTCEWDTAAAQAVLEGAGGFVCDLSGKPLRYGKATHLNPHFIAASVPLDRLFEG